LFKDWRSIELADASSSISFPSTISPEPRSRDANTGWEELRVDRRSADSHGASYRADKAARVIEVNLSPPDHVSRDARKDETRLGTQRRISPLTARRDSRSRKRQSIIRSSPSWPAFRRHIFCSRISTHVGMRSLSGFERIDVGSTCLCDSADISSLTGKNSSVNTTQQRAFRKRALCAVRETRAVADLLSPIYFIQAQIFPYNYQDVIVRGNATRINGLFLREIYRQRHSIPRCDGSRIRRRLHAIFFTGVSAQRLALRYSRRSIPPSCSSSIAGPPPISSRFSVDLLRTSRTFSARSESEHARRRMTARSSNISTRSKTPSRS